MAIVFATEEAWISQTVMTKRGEIWDAEDEVVKGRPDMFTSDGEPFARRTADQSSVGMFPPAAGPVESATAAPGEKRTIAPPAGATQRGRR